MLRCSLPIESAMVGNILRPYSFSRPLCQPVPENRSASLFLANQTLEAGIFSDMWILRQARLHSLGIRTIHPGGFCGLRTKTLRRNPDFLFCNDAMVRREGTDWVCNVRVPRKQKRLASTTAEVFTPTLTSLARCPHPGFTPE